MYYSSLGFYAFYYSASYCKRVDPGLLFLMIVVGCVYVLAFGSMVHLRVPRFPFFLLLGGAGATSEVGVLLFLRCRSARAAPVPRFL